MINREKFHRTFLNKLVIFRSRHQLEFDYNNSNSSNNNNNNNRKFRRLLKRHGVVGADNFFKTCPGRGGANLGSFGFRLLSHS